MTTALEGFPSIVRFPIHWGEMDAFGHVNNVSYFRYFETGRLDYFARAGINDHMTHHNQGPILAHTQCRFRQPLTWPATIAVGTRVEDIGEDRFTMIYRIVLDDGGDTVVAEGTGRIVWYDYSAALKCPLPENIRANMGAMGT